MKDIINEKIKKSNLNLSLDTINTINDKIKELNIPLDFFNSVEGLKIILNSLKGNYELKFTLDIYEELKELGGDEIFYCFSDSKWKNIDYLTNIRITNITIKKEENEYHVYYDIEEEKEIEYNYGSFCYEVEFYENADDTKIIESNMKKMSLFEIVDMISNENFDHYLG